MSAPTTDFNPGDPYLYVGGGKEEQPARKHAPQKPKPNKTARGIAADVKHRLQVLEPVLQEYEALKKLDAIFNPPPAKRGRSPKK